MDVRRLLQARIVWLAVAGIIGPLLAACSQVQHRENGLLFSEWYIVKSVVDTGMTTAYGKIKNSTAKNTTVDAVSLDCADKAELHETLESGGRVSMVTLKNVPLPAGFTISFEPGSKHIMISGFRQPSHGKCTATFRMAGSDVSFAIPVLERKE